MRKYKDLTKQKYEVKKSLASDYGSQCYYCDEKMTIDKLTLDHIYPVSKLKKKYHQTLSSAHCVLSCQSCNKLKASRIIPMEDFRKEIMGDKYYPVKIKLKPKQDTTLSKIEKRKIKNREVSIDLTKIKYPENPIVKSKFSLWLFIKNMFK